MGSRPPRRRGKGRSGTTAGALFVVACLIVLALTFTLGMLVGRQWARRTAPQARVAVDGDQAVGGAPQGESARPRTRLLSEREPDEAAPQIREKLTFYHTLTAPLTAGPPPAAQSRPAVAPGAEPGRQARAEPEARPGPTADTPYTVQVAAFKTREQALALRDRLGPDAYVVEVEGASPVRYRVRVGAFASRALAEAAAARLRAERSVGAFVTQR